MGKHPYVQLWLQGLTMHGSGFLTNIELLLWEDRLWRRAAGFVGELPSFGICLFKATEFLKFKLCYQNNQLSYSHKTQSPRFGELEVLRNEVMCLYSHSFRFYVWHVFSLNASPNGELTTTSLPIPLLFCSELL